MTEGEAEQLIAEINEYHKKVCDYHCDACRPDYAQIQKIIKRFAKKPPEKGYTFYHNGSWHTTLCIHKEDPEYICLVIGYCERPDETYLYKKIELKQLRDNINKMLEYLKHEDDRA